jgi:hypothetical protein
MVANNDPGMPTTISVGWRGNTFQTRLAGKGYLAHRVFALPAI